jgi:5-methylcytosine-specific restriction endonuclease McrA
LWWKMASRAENLKATRKYQAAHPDRVLESTRKYREANREKMNAATRKWSQEHQSERRLYRQKHRERGRAYAAAWRLAHPEKAAKAWREWNIRNPEKRRKIERAWLEKTPLARATFNANRAARRRRAAGGGVSAAQWNGTVEEYGGRCAYCAQLGRPTMDHIEPLSKGGEHDVANVVPVCKSCNSRKNTKTLAVWLISLTQRRSA